MNESLLCTMAVGQRYQGDKRTGGALGVLNQGMHEKAFQPLSARLHLGASVCYCQMVKAVVANIAERAQSPSYPVIFGLRDLIGRYCLNLPRSNIVGGWDAVWMARKTHHSEMFMIIGMALIPWNVINMPVIEIPQISLEEQRKYAGRHAAIVEGKVVSSGDTAREAFQKAKELFPEKKTDEIGLLYIPREEMMIL